MSKLNPSTLQDLVDLLKEKQALETQLGRVDAKIAAAIAGKKVAAVKVVKGKRGPKPKAAPAKAVAKKSGKRGKLKESILALLEKAGAAGVSAKDVSKKLGIPNQHVHVWFGTTGKKIQGLIKPSKGVWALKSK